MNNNIDYRKLLSKYINHVGECEGITFLDDCSRYDSEVVFTDEEWEELGGIYTETLIQDTSNVHNTQ